jgi:hypothetical protein
MLNFLREYREGVRLWNDVPEPWLDLDKPKFYGKLKQRELIEGLAAPLHQYSSFNNI